MNYVQTWAEVVAAALIEGHPAEPQDANVEELNEARRSAWEDANATLNNLGEGKREQVAAQLKKDYGDVKNAKLALVDELVKRGGYEKLVFHERTDDEKKEDEAEGKKR